MSTYTVQRGDCLSAIARRFNTTVDALAKANNIQNVDLIHTGATLTIPDGFDQSSAPAPSPKLRQGSRGPEVEQLQSDLVKLGYMSQAAMNTGPGIFGERTRAAVERFQAAHGLEVDGIVGPRTQAALQARLAGAPEPEQPQRPDQPQQPDGPSSVSGIEDRPGVRGTADQAIQFFMSKGLTREQAAGIAGNLFHESSFSPNAVGDNGTSFGIAQWHLGRGDAMKAWTRANGYASNSFRGQLEFLWHELNTSESNALSRLRQTSSAYDAGMAFQRWFERPAHISEERGRTSQRFYQESLS